MRVKPERRGRGSTDPTNACIAVRVSLRAAGLAFYRGFSSTPTALTGYVAWLPGVCRA